MNFRGVILIIMSDNRVSQKNQHRKKRRGENKVLPAQDCHCILVSFQPWLASVEIDIGGLVHCKRQSSNLPHPARKDS